MLNKSHGRLLCDAYELATYQYIENLVFFCNTSSSYVRLHRGLHTSSVWGDYRKNLAKVNFSEVMPVLFSSFCCMLFRGIVI